MKLTDFFELRGILPKKTGTIVAVVGFFVLLGTWQAVSMMSLIPRSLLPPLDAVFSSFKELHFEDALIRNALYSIKLNVLGYLEAIAISIPVGMAMGLFPVIRSSTNAYIKALRFLPLAAVTGLFIAWFGIADNMKIQFLAVSIIVYLIPVVIQRVDDVETVYLQTAHTMGANPLQTILYVFWPSIRSKIIDDIKVLVAISWTYITIAEALNMSAGGIGALAVKCGRQSRVDKVFAVLLVIIFIGFIQDRLFYFIDKKANPHKYV